MIDDFSPAHLTPRLDLWICESISFREVRFKSQVRSTFFQIWVSDFFKTSYCHDFGIVVKPGV